MAQETKETNKNKEKSKIWLIEKALPVVLKAVAAGLNEREIGILLGYLGENPQKTLVKIEKKCPGDPVKIALKMANSYLVSKLYQAATKNESEVSLVKLLVKNQLSSLFPNLKGDKIDSVADENLLNNLIASLNDEPKETKQ